MPSTQPAYARAKEYAYHQAESPERMDLIEFFKNVHEQFYQDIDVNFMEYFLSIAQQEGEFVVPHSALRDYGVMTSNESGDVKKKMDLLGLVKDHDYILGDVSENSIGRPAKHYHLTPDAFKTCVMRAMRRADQPVDPLIYVKYYILLEKIFGLYRDYQQRIADLELDKLKRENEKLTHKNHNLKTTQDLILEKLDLVLAKNDLLLSDATDARTDRTAVLKKLDTVVDMLQQKSLVSTMNPTDPKLHHNFVCMGHRVDDDTRKLVFIAGQEMNVRTAMRKHFDDRSHDWTVQIGIHYNANPIDLRNNIHTRVHEYIKKIVSEENARSMTVAKERNNALKEEILLHNRERREPRRVFKAEKVNATKITRANIPITCTKTSLTFANNDYIEFDELIELIRNVNEETQKSPYQSPAQDNGDEEEYE